MGTSGTGKENGSRGRPESGRQKIDDYFITFLVMKF